MTRPATYLPTPTDAPVVHILDNLTGDEWKGVMVDGIVHDANGFLDPHDVGDRYTVTGPLATREEIMRSRTSGLVGYEVTSDRAVGYTPIGVRDDRSLWAISHTLNVIVMVTRTGEVPVRGRGDQVRVRINFPTDTGDAAGTLRFDGEHIGGLAPRVLFAG
jgi:hypothetical protein